MPATAFAAQNYSIAQMWAGAVEDYTFDWAWKMQFSALASATYGQSATGANGSGWSAVGETASSFNFYVPAGLSALASATAQFWSAYLTASAGGPTSASASSLTGVQSTVRISATGAVGNYLISARMRTSSGRELRDVFTASIVG